MKKERLDNKYCITLIIISVIVYYVAYLGRYSYSSNINLIMDFYSVNKSSAGAISSCFFISYGVGQVVHGLLCKKYNPRYSIAIALFVSALMNLSLGFIGVEHFNLLKYCWLLNGFVQAILWSSIIRLLNENLPKNYLSIALLMLSLPVSLGTFSIYGLSALISALSISFKTVFFISGGLLLVMCIIWFSLVDYLKSKSKIERDLEQDEQNLTDSKTEEAKNNAPNNSFILIFAILALLAIANNFVKDGLTTWMPTILKDIYSLDNSISTFLTLFLPFFAVFGSTVALFMNKKLKNYVLVCGVFYIIALILFLLVLIFLNLQTWILPLICFILVAMAMSGVNNIITSIFPMLYASKGSAGTLAGVLDGFCYVGSAITAYGLGAISEKFVNWNTVFYLFIAVCAIMMLICLVYYLLTKNSKQKN
ncbi:MAG: MFS transporter [Clostridia bacterium]|nr:MFS transporter [Clostridia bacterium]